MIVRFSSRFSPRFPVLRLLVLAGLVATQAQAQTAPIIVSTVPAMMATGVSPTAPVVITFSEAMNPDPSVTTAFFMDSSGFPPTMLPTVASWSADNKRLTNTPVQPFPANKMIVWGVDGENLMGDPLGGTTGGYFITGSSGGGGGNECTNLVGSFTLAKGALYQQTSAGAPTPNADAPFVFVACSTVACSNSATTSISLTPPSGAPSSLMGTPIPGHYTLTAPVTSLTALEGLYPNGNYTFNLQSSAGTLPFPATFPSTLVLPNAPRLANFTAAQTIDPTQPFTLGWDAFQNGTTADVIYVEIYGGVFQTPALGTPGALSGLARSVTIPANTLQPNHTYTGALYFYDYTLVTNRYVTLCYRSSSTEFSLATSSGTPATPLVLTNLVKSVGSFSFEVSAAAGQALTIEYSTNLLSGQWQTLQTTNSPGGRVLITDPRAQTNRATFYRVKRG